MLFIDADISFTLEQILAMLEWSQSNPGIVAGRYRAKHKAVDYVGVLENEFSSQRFRKAVFAGTGFMLTPRPVLERLIATYTNRKYFSTHVPDTKGGFAFFEPMIDPETRECLSEDFAFCRLCRAAGIDVWLDTASKLVNTGACDSSNCHVRSSPVPGRYGGPCEQSCSHRLNYSIHWQCDNRGDRRGSVAYHWREDTTMKELAKAAWQDQAEKFWHKLVPELPGELLMRVAFNFGAARRVTATDNRRKVAARKHAVST